MATYVTVVAQRIAGVWRDAGYEFEDTGYRQGAIVSMFRRGLIDRADSGGASDPDAGLVEANVQTASYTLTADDAGKAVEMDVAGSNDLTVPPNSSVAFPAGTVVEVAQVGAGQTTIVAGSGVTVRTPETLVLSGQWSTVSLRKRGTDEWLLVGDVEASA